MKDGQEVALKVFRMIIGFLSSEGLIDDHPQKGTVDIWVKGTKRNQQITIELTQYIYMLRSIQDLDAEERKRES